MVALRACWHAIELGRRQVAPPPPIVGLVPIPIKYIFPQCAHDTRSSLVLLRVQPCSIAPKTCNETERSGHTICWRDAALSRRLN